MKRLLLIPAALAAIALSGIAVPAQASTTPASTDMKTRLKWDRYKICHTDLKVWNDLDVLANDRGDDVRLSDFGTPDEGVARLVFDSHGVGTLQYRNDYMNGTFRTYYEVHDIHGRVKIAFWTVTVLRDC